MSNSIEHTQDLAQRLRSLRNTLSGSAQSAGYLKFFDEFLGESEFELALHAVCDYLLESSALKVTTDTIQQINVLHQLMEISDDCVEQLNAKDA